MFSFYRGLKILLSCPGISENGVKLMASNCTVYIAGCHVYGALVCNQVSHDSGSYLAGTGSLTDRCVARPVFYSKHNRDT